MYIIIHSTPEPVRMWRVKYTLKKVFFLAISLTRAPNIHYALRIVADFKSRVPVLSEPNFVLKCRA